MRIMILEDDKELARIYERILSSEFDFEMIMFEDGKAALEHCLEVEEPYDMMICDIELPHIKGNDFADTLVEKRPEFANSKFIFISGVIDEAIGFAKKYQTHLIEKPVRKVQLVNIIKIYANEISKGQQNVG